jgi:hypothetical protein
MTEKTNDPQIDSDDDQRKIILRKISTMVGLSVIPGRFIPPDIDTVIRQVAAKTKYDVVPGNHE